MSDQIVGLINPGMSLIFAAGGFALWLRDKRMVYILGYVFAAVLLGLSFAVNHYNTDPDDRLVQMAIAVLSITANISLAWSMCNRMNQPAPLKLWIAGGVGTVGLVYLSDPARDVSVSLFAVNACCGVVMIMATQLMALSKSQQLVDRLLVWMFALVSVQFFVRPVVVIMQAGAMSTGEYRDGVGHAVLVVTAALLTLMLTAAIVAATISDQIRAVKQSVRKDELSGLLRRSAFEDDAYDLIKQAQKAGKPISLMIADVDNFKQVNDQWGHPAGDAAIFSFGDLIARTIRSDDLAGRIGGEEFCILVWDCYDKDAANLADRLRVLWSELPHRSMAAQTRLTASFGVAQWQPGESYADMYARADAALYRAKREGRNRVVIHNASQANAAPHGSTVQPITGLGPELYSGEAPQQNRGPLVA